MKWSIRDNRQQWRSDTTRHYNAAVHEKLPLNFEESFKNSKVFSSENPPPLQGSDSKINFSDQFGDAVQAQ